MAELDFSEVKALAIEDDISGMALIGVMMQRLGLQTYIDSSGERALTLARSIEPHIIFLDLNMPKKSGYEVAQEIRSDNRLNGVMVVAVSATDPHTAIPKCKAIGFNGFIAKPLRRRKFADQVRRLMDGEEIWDGAQPPAETYV